MAERAIPPPDISPAEFFQRWIPLAVQGDPERRRQIADLEASIQFELEGEQGGDYFVLLAGGAVLGAVGRTSEPDVTLSLGVETWRRLNAGELSALRAAATGALRFRGSLYLALRVHFLLR